MQKKVLQTVQKRFPNYWNIFKNLTYNKISAKIYLASKQITC